MLETLGIVQACFPSSRCRAIANRKLGGMPLLEWVVRRVTDSTQLDGVIVLANSEAEQESLQDLVPSDVPILVSEKGDSLKRFARALEAFSAKSVVRIFGDNPFVDPALIDRLVITARSNPECDYVSYCSRDGKPAILSPVGVFAEWFRCSALHRAAKSAREESERNHVTRYLYSHPETFNIRLIPAPSAIDRDDVRLTVDMEEDWDHALAIVEALGTEALDWQRIADLLDHQPRLRSRMAALNRARQAG